MGALRVTLSLPEAGAWGLQHRSFCPGFSDPTRPGSPLRPAPCRAGPAGPLAGDGGRMTGRARVRGSRVGALAGPAPGSPALLMMAARLRFGTTENPAENEG